MVKTKYLLDLIKQKNEFFQIPDFIYWDFDIWVHERIYIWAVELCYYLEKIENKDELVEEIIKTS